MRSSVCFWFSLSPIPGGIWDLSRFGRRMPAPSGKYGTNAMPCSSQSRSTSSLARSMRWWQVLTVRAWLDGPHLGPAQLDPLRFEQILQLLNQCRGPHHSLRDDTGGHTVGGDDAGRLPDVPLRWMHPEAAVGDVRHRDVLRRRQDVLDPDRDQRRQRYLVRQRGDVQVVGTRGGRVQVDPVAPDANARAQRRGDTSSTVDV